MASANKVRLTDPKIENLKPATAADGGRYEVLDTQVPGFGVRVTQRGTRTFMLKTRYPGSSNPTRRALGEYPVISLSDARQKAINWLVLIKRGIDPTEQEKSIKIAEQRKRANTFSAVVNDFNDEKLTKERAGKEVLREINLYLMPKLAGRPITEITDEELASIIKGIAREGARGRPAPVQARNLLATVKRFFQWAIDQRAYGLRTSPAATLRASSLIGERNAPRDRVLSDDEIAALWIAAGKIGYPHGPAFRLLMLSALRLNEVADAAKAEMNKRDSVWVIPGARMKAKNSRARPHAVPLIQDITKIFDAIPKLSDGDFIFSTTHGKKPIWIGSKIKKKLDKQMLLELKAITKNRREDPTKVTIERWTPHDIRRTVRSHLSRLKISEEAREAVLAHGRPGIKAVYDWHDYLDEKREALSLWSSKLHEIVQGRQPKARKKRASA
jgi:integrase